MGGGIQSFSKNTCRSARTAWVLCPFSKGTLVYGPLPLPTVPLLSADHLHVTLDDTSILHELSFALEPGSWTGLLGPNGSGKTTLLRTIAGVLPYEGTLQLEGRPIRHWTPGELARRLAFVRQSPNLTFEFSVEEMVLLGRAPHKRWLQPYGAEDRSLVRRALAQVHLEGFADRSVLSLSGGEMQRVFLAQALAQEADLLLLDEPTAHLDVHYQFTFMDLVKDLAHQGRTIFAVFHDLELAARYADRLLVLQKGRLAAQGPPGDVLTRDLIASVFNMDARVFSGPDGSLRIDYRGRARDATPSPATSAAPAPVSS